MAFDPYALSSGLPLADVDVTVTKAEFRFETEYSAEALVCVIEFTPESGEPQEQYYSCGKGWEPLDRGAAAGHVSGRDMNFNGQSGIGRFLAHAFECDGFLDDVKSEGVVPTQAEFYVGRKFHLGTVQVTTTNPKTGKEKTNDFIIPVEYYGTDAGDSGGKAPAKKSAAKGPSAIEKKQLALIDQLTEENSDLVDALVELAGEVDDHDEFMEAAMELDGVADSELAQQVAMSSKAGSIWAQAQG